MKKRIAVLIFFLASLFVFAGDLNLTDEEKQFLSTHHLIRAHNSQDWIPFNFYRNGRAQGYAIDFLDLLAGKLGIEFEYISGPTLNQFCELFKEHKIDVMSNVVKSEDFGKMALFSLPYIKYAPAIICKSAANYGNLASLNGKTVALAEGCWYRDALKNNYPEVNFLLLKSEKELLNAVSKGSAAAAVGNGAVLKYLWLANNITEVKIAGEVSLPMIEEHYLRIGIRQDWPLLQSALNKAILNVSLQEELELKRKWVDLYTGERAVKFRLTSEEIAYLQKKGVIRMCVDPDFLPYEGINKTGDYVGIAADFMALIRDELPIPIKLMPTKNWDETLQMAKSKQCDILPLLNLSQKREEYLNFTTPYVTDAIVIVARKDTIYLNGIKSLAGKTVSMPQGYFMGEVISQQYPEVKIVYVDSEAEALKLVSEGRAFATITSILTSTRAIQYLGLSNLKIAGQTELRNNFRIGVNKDDHVLLSIFQKAVDSIDEKTSNEILRHWYTVEFQHVADWRIVWQIAAIAVVFFFLLIMNIITSRRFRLKLTNSNIALQVKNDELNDLKVQLENNVKELNTLAITDKLTGLFNRVKIDSVLKDEANRSKRYNYSFGIILMDIDYFKRVNDTFGHQVGDEILIGLSRLLQMHTRETDIIGRWGGEEFIIICPQSTISGVIKLAKYLKESIENNDFPVIGSLTASFGVTISKQGRVDSITQIISRADKALYDAKKAGRNTVKIG